MTTKSTAVSPVLDKPTRDRVNEALRGVTKVGDIDKFLERIAEAGIQHFPKPKIDVPKITEAHIEALRRLPEIYGKVVPKTDRPLNSRELAAIAEERQTIDLVLKLLEARKSDSIRETLANHMDHVYAKDHPGEEVPTDKRGHTAVKDEVLVPGTRYKIQRTVSGGKRVLSINEVEILHDEGKISDQTYEQITRKITPPVTPLRVLDEEGLVQAMKADPGLAYNLAMASRVSDMTTSITIREV